MALDKIKLLVFVGGLLSFTISINIMGREKE